MMAAPCACSLLNGLYRNDEIGLMLLEMRIKCADIKLDGSGFLIIERVHPGSIMHAFAGFNIDGTVFAGNY
ncbi:hypothetical protein D3C78_1916850 [compost metagenome]